MMETVGLERRAMARHDVVVDLAAHRHAIDAQQVARAVIGLDQHADGEALAGFGRDAACRADAALEFMADHAGAAADIALGHRAALGIFQRLMGHGLGHRKGLGIGEVAIMGLGHDRQMEGLDDALLRRIAADGVAHHAHAMGAGDADGRGEQALLREPDRAGHLAIAVEAVESGEAVIGEDVAMGPDHGDAGAHHRRLVADQGRMPDLDTGHIGDRVQRSGGQPAKGDPKVA